MARGVRRRGVTVVVAGVCVASVVAAVTGAVSSPLPPDFLTSGHWVFNAAFGQAVHVSGPTGTVDARAGVPADEGSIVLQGDTSGFVVGNGESTEFDKSTLEVVGSKPVPTGEHPEYLTAAGGPYLVYRKMGTVVRLGEPSAVVNAGEPVGTPVATGDGTVYLHRPDSGVLCKLARGADKVSCPLAAPKGHGGALTVVADKPVFVDTASDTVHALGATALEAGAGLGFDAPDSVRVAAHDVAGRIAVLDKAQNRMHLVNAAKPTENPIVVPVPPGDYADPASTGAVVALVDKTTRTLYTYDSSGKPGEVKEIPAERGDPRISRGEDARVYVDGAEGKHVLVVGKDGDVADVPITPGKPGRVPSPPPTEPPPPTTQPPARQPDIVALPPVVPNRQQPAPPVRTQQPPAVPPPVPASPPGAPASVAATAGNRTANVTWGPAPDNGAAVTGYVVSWTGSNGAAGSTPAGPASRSLAVPNLVNGTGYTFSVRAANSAGQGPAVAASPVTPQGTPTATISRGRHECWDEDGRVPDEYRDSCYYMHLVLADFNPNTRYLFRARWDKPEPWSVDKYNTTDSNGALVWEPFSYYGTGYNVWIEVHTPEGIIRTAKLRTG